MRGWRAASDAIVFDVINRDRHVKAILIAHDELETMRKIQAHTREVAPYYTDAYQACATLRPRGGHVMIRREKDRLLGNT